jgi:hypothetical protein
MNHKSVPFVVAHTYGVHLWCPPLSFHEFCQKRRGAVVNSYDSCDFVALWTSFGALTRHLLPPLIIMVLEGMQAESTHLNVGSKSWRWWLVDGG